MKFSLNTKITFSICIVTLTALAFFAFLNIRTLQRIFLEEAVADAGQLSETIIQTTHHQMLKNDREAVALMIREVGRRSYIDHIRMINKQGKIFISTRPGEEGQLLHSTEPECTICHAGGGKPLLSVSSTKRSRIYRNAAGEELMGMATAIYNEESCSAAPCHYHPATDRILGVLDVSVSLERMHSRIAYYRNRFIDLSFFLLLMILTGAVFFMKRMVALPVTRLVAHTRKVGQGELESTTEILSHDELGELTEAFNAMTVNLKKAHDELEEWGKMLEAKVEERTGEVKQMQEQLVRSEKLASLGELVAGIAHELNNPLTGILMFASMARDDERLPPDLKRDMETIVRETEKCGGIVRGLLGFSRESVPRKELTSLNRTLDSSLALVEFQPMFHNIRVVRMYAAALPEVMADPNQMTQVFVNILVNGAQAMPDGGTLTLSTGVTADGYWVFASISDTGCGIPEKNLVKIFDPFFTTKDTKGTGLGLSVSYGIIANHGGSIGVKSTVGEGTTFTVDLPLMAEANARPEQDLREGSGEGSAPGVIV